MFFDRREILRITSAVLFSMAIPIDLLSAADEGPLQPTARLLRALRRLRIAWNWSVESGGPIVDFEMPYGSANADRDLRDLAGTEDRKSADAFHIAVARGFLWALEHGELKEGRYTIAPLTNQSMRDRVRRDFGKLPEDRLNDALADLPKLSPDGSFTITRAHRLLIKAIRFDWPAPPDVARDEEMLIVPIVHFKRPFGDMSAFEIDMARIIGQQPPASDPHFNRLYLEMWPALQAFVQHADIPVRPDAA